MPHTHTFVTLAVKPSTFEEIYQKLKAAGYDEALEHSADGKPTLIDMHGLALTKES